MEGGGGKTVGIEIYYLHNTMYSCKHKVFRYHGRILSEWRGEGSKAGGIERYITYVTQCVAVRTKFSDISTPPQICLRKIPICISIAACQGHAPGTASYPLTMNPIIPPPTSF